MQSKRELEDRIKQFRDILVSPPYSLPSGQQLLADIIVQQRDALTPEEAVCYPDLHAHLMADCRKVRAEAILAIALSVMPDTEMWVHWWVRLPDGRISLPSKLTGLGWSAFCLLLAKYCAGTLHFDFQHILQLDSCRLQSLCAAVKKSQIKSLSAEFDDPKLESEPELSLSINHVDEFLQAVKDNPSISSISLSFRSIGQFELSFWQSISRALKLANIDEVTFGVDADLDPAYIEGVFNIIDSEHLNSFALNAKIPEDNLKSFCTLIERPSLEVLIVNEVDILPASDSDWQEFTSALARSNLKTLEIMGPLWISDRISISGWQNFCCALGQSTIEVTVRATTSCQ